MFDFRYHALSLVGVLVALMVGVLLGIAIGDKGLVSSAGENIRKSLRKDVRAARKEATQLRGNINDHKVFEQDAYPLLVQGRLAGQRIGVVGIGPLPDNLVSNLRNSLKDTGGRLAVVAAVRQPISLQDMPADPRSRGRRHRVIVLSPNQRIVRYGDLVGTSLVRGTGFAKSVSRSLLESSSGKLDGVDAVVLVRSPANLAARDARAARLFETGLVRGLAGTGVPVVGTETTNARPSQVPWFKAHRLTSVDDADQLAGHVALVFALAGANGAYGVKPTAEALLPPAVGGAGAG